MSKDKRQGNSTQKERLSSISASEVQKSITPTDSSKELLSNDQKDRQLYKFAKKFQKQDYYDRNRFTANVTHLLGYLFSAASIYLSFAFLDTHLTNDVPIKEVRYSVIIGILLLVEFVKHTALHTGFKAFFVYSKKPIFTSLLFVAAVSLSLYLCINGTSELNRNSYQPPQITDFTTHYDSKIANLEQKNKNIYKRNSWKGKLNAHSQAGKAYAKNETLISEWKAAAEKERTKQHEQALSDYDHKHGKTSMLRSFIGYFVEASILFCVIFYLTFCYRSQLEHLLRLNKKYAFSLDSVLPKMPTNTNDIAVASTNQKKLKIGFNTNNDNSTNNDANHLINRQITNNEKIFSADDIDTLIKHHRQRVHAYNNKLKNGKGNPNTNRQRVAKHTSEYNRLTDLKNRLYS